MRDLQIKVKIPESKVPNRVRSWTLLAKHATNPEMISAADLIEYNDDELQIRELVLGI